ncbi:uncharacterized protein LOC142107093 isoform X2 [Mixophyes fleayi]
MKILVVSLVILSITGTHGFHLSQQDEPQPSKPAVKESLKRVIRNTFVLGAEIISNIGSSEESKQSELIDRVGLIVTGVYDLFDGIFHSVRDTAVEVEKEIHKQYPVYRNTVIPIIVEFVTNISTQLMILSPEITPYFKTLETEVRKQQVIFLKHLHALFLRDEKKWSSLVDNLNARLQPFIDEVRQEVERAKKQETYELPKQHEDFPNSGQIKQYSQTLRKVISKEEDMHKLIAELEELYKNKA